jgi:hypothetical protein
MANVSSPKDETPGYSFQSFAEKAKGFPLLSLLQTSYIILLMQIIVLIIYQILASSRFFNFFIIGTFLILFPIKIKY